MDHADPKHELEGTGDEDLVRLQKAGQRAALFPDAKAQFLGFAEDYSSRDAFKAARRQRGRVDAVAIDPEDIGRGDFRNIASQIDQ
jgi:hypothetical protein